MPDNDNTSAHRLTDLQNRAKTIFATFDELRGFL